MPKRDFPLRQFLDYRFDSTVKTPIRNITRSAAKVFRIGGLFRIGGSIFWSKNIIPPTVRSTASSANLSQVTTALLELSKLGGNAQKWWPNKLQTC